MVIFVGALPSNLSPSPTIYNSSLEVTPVVYVLSGTVLLFFLVNHSKIQVLYGKGRENIIIILKIIKGITRI